jgi:hypothetical protein
MDSFILTLALAVLKSVVKNPEKKVKLRSVLLQVRDAITTVFDE